MNGNFEILSRSASRKNKQTKLNNLALDTNILCLAVLTFRSKLLFFSTDVTTFHPLFVLFCSLLESLRVKFTTNIFKVFASRCQLFRIRLYIQKSVFHVNTMR